MYYSGDKKSLKKSLVLDFDYKYVFSDQHEHKAQILYSIMLILNSFCAALWYLEQLQDTRAPRSLKSHVVTPFGTSFLGVASVG